MSKVGAVLSAAVLVLTAIAMLPSAAATSPTPAVIATIEIGGGSQPYFSHYIPGAGPFSGYFSVSDYGAAKVSFIGAANDTLFKNVTVQTNPAGQELLTPGGPANVGNFLWVTDRGSHNVSVINLTSFTVVRTIPVGTQPIGIQYDSTNNTVWVANWGGTNLTILNATTYAHIRSVTVGTAPLYVYYDEDANTMQVTDWTTGDVRFIGASNYSTYATTSGLGEPSAITSSSGAGSYHESFVSDYSAGVVSVISHTTHLVIVNITVGSHPYGDGWDNQTSDQYVANSGANTVSVISAASNSVVATITVGTNPYSAQAYDPVHGYILVCNYGSGNVSVISDGTGGAVIPGGGAAALGALVVPVIALGAVFALIVGMKQTFSRRKD
jgi:YVTN family beta-propeller protein